MIALHSLPHTPTPNFGPNPRINVYFRIRRLRPENPHEGSRRVAHGVSDHPDRGYFGQYLDYPDHYDPGKPVSIGFVITGANGRHARFIANRSIQEGLTKQRTVVCVFITPLSRVSSTH